MNPVLRVVFSSSFALASSVALCQSLQQTVEFKPEKLVGEWNFQNRQTGVKYGGAIAIHLLRIEAGKMRGTVSYDGRQTNDKCSTRGLLSDTPVGAEIEKTAAGYRISFRMNCSIGESPREFVWNLACSPDGTCSEPTTRPWGAGMISVTAEKEK